jgi:hypothetical protein
MTHPPSFNQPGAPDHIPPPDPPRMPAPPLSRGRKLVLGGGGVGVIAFFLPWYTLRGSSTGGVASASALARGGMLLLVFVGLLLVVGVAALPFFGKHLHALVPTPSREGQVIFVGALGVFSMALLGTLLARPIVIIATITTSLGSGFWIAVVALGIMVAGGRMMAQRGE